MYLHYFFWYWEHWTKNVLHGFKNECSQFKTKCSQLRTLIRTLFISNCSNSRTMFLDSFLCVGFSRHWFRRHDLLLLTFLHLMLIDPLSSTVCSVILLCTRHRRSALEVSTLSLSLQTFVLQTHFFQLLVLQTLNLHFLRLLSPNSHPTSRSLQLAITFR